MSDANMPIDFAQEKQKREHDDNTKMQMPDGSWWYLYSCEYTYDDGTCGQGIPEEILTSDSGIMFQKNKWSIDFWAMNDDDAKRKAAAIKNTLGDPERVVGAM